MDFLKSAVASAISKGYPSWGYSFGDRVDIDDSIWTLHNGTKRVWPGYPPASSYRADWGSRKTGPNVASSPST